MTDNPDKMYLAGIDIGGTKCAAVLGSMDASGKLTILDKTVYQTTDHPLPGKMIGQLIEGLAALLSGHGIPVTDIAGIGISCGGPLNSNSGVILSPPNLPGWDAVPVTAIVNKHFNVPVWLQNDANACALAEWKFGAGKGCQHLVFLTFGTGMGAGLILNGQLYAGASDMAGEIGHVRMENTGPVGYGKSGSFEGFCSGGGITQLAKMKAREKLQAGQKVSFCDGITAIDSITAAVVATAAAGGDTLAKEIYELSGTYLGKGLSIVIDLLNPEIIIIGSVFVKSGLLMQAAMEKTIAAESIAMASNACRIVPAALGDSIGDYAALSVAANKIKQ